MSKTTKIIIVIAVLAVIGLIAWYVYSQKSTKTETKSDSTGTTTSKDTSKAQDILNTGGEVLETLGNSNLFS